MGAASLLSEPTPQQQPGHLTKVH